MGDGGIGAIIAVDFSLTNRLALRAQGSWRRSSFTTVEELNLTRINYDWTVWSCMGGLAVDL